MFDQTDMQILKLITENARMTQKEIGEAVHMTGQAVGNRIKKLEDHAIIKRYTIDVDYDKLGQSVIAFITLILKLDAHAKVRNFVHSHDEVLECHRITGDGCYLIKGRFTSNQALTKFTGELLTYGNYRINLSIEAVK